MSTLIGAQQKLINNAWNKNNSLNFNNKILIYEVFNAFIHFAPIETINFQKNNAEKIFQKSFK